MVVMQTLCTNMTSLCHIIIMLYITGFQLFGGVNHDGCHIWGRKFSLFGKPDLTTFWVYDVNHALYIILCITEFVSSCIIFTILVCFSV